MASAARVSQHCMHTQQAHIHTCDCTYAAAISGTRNGAGLREARRSITWKKRVVTQNTG